MGAPAAFNSPGRRSVQPESGRSSPTAAAGARVLLFLLLQFPILFVLWVSVFLQLFVLFGFLFGFQLPFLVTLQADDGGILPGFVQNFIPFFIIPTDYVSKQNLTKGNLRACLKEDSDNSLLRHTLPGKPVAGQCEPEGRGRAQS